MLHLLSSVGGIGSGSEFILMDLPRTLEEVFLINLLKLCKKKKKKDNGNAIVQFSITFYKNGWEHIVAKCRHSRYKNIVYSTDAETKS